MINQQKQHFPNSLHTYDKNSEQDRNREYLFLHDKDHILKNVGDFIFNGEKLNIFSHGQKQSKDVYCHHS